MTITEKIEKALESVRPGLQMDGGDVRFAGFDEATGELDIALLGMCTHCAMSQYTVEGIAEAVKKEVPEVKKVRLAN